MPAEIPKIRDILGDPLSDIARKERRNLLAAAVIGSFVVLTGLVPSKVTTLGIDLNLAEQRYFLVLLGLVVAYFLVAFILYGTADYFIWREKYREYLVNVEREMDSFSMGNEPDPNDPSERVPHIGWIYRWSQFVAKSRFLFEYALPIFLGIYALGALLFAALKAA